jgi:hypothetical protein
VGFLFSAKKFGKCARESFEDAVRAEGFEKRVLKAASPKMFMDRTWEGKMKLKGTSHDHLDETARDAAGD